MIKLNYIGICLALVLNCFWGVAQPEDIKKQALDDAHSLSAQSYPAIEDFHKALRLQLAGSNDEAKKIYLKLLKKNPENDALYYALGNLAQEEKDFTTAENYYTEAYTLDPKNIYYVEILAMVRSELGKFEQALPLWEKVVENQPRDYNFQYYLAQTYVQLGQYKEAVKALDNVEGLVGINPQISRLKIEMLPLIGEENRIDEEITNLRLADPYNPETQNYILRHYIQNGGTETFKKRLTTEFKQESPNVSTYLYLLKIQPEISKEFKIELLKKAISNKDFPPITIAENLLYLEENKVFSKDSIQRMAEELQNNYSDYPAIMDELNHYFKESGKANNLLLLAEQRLEENPNDYKAWLDLNLQQAQLGLFNKLNTSVDQALENYPLLPQFYFLNAQVLAFYNEKTLAQESFDTGESYLIVPTDTTNFLNAISAAHLALLEHDVKAYKSAMLKAKAFEKMKNDYDIAALHFQHFYKAPTLVQLENVDDKLDVKLYFLALENIQHEDYISAHDFIKTFIASYPDHANAWDLLGDIYLKQDQQEKAIAAWKKAKNLITNNLNINKKLETNSFYEQKYY